MKLDYWIFPFILGFFVNHKGGILFIRQYVADIYGFLWDGYSNSTVPIFSNVSFNVSSIHDIMI